MPSALRTAILAHAPSVYWPLDELSGLTAFDISGNSRNGTYTAAISQGFPGVPGDTGTAIELFPQPGAAPFKGVTLGGLADSGNLTIIFFFKIYVNSFGASEVPFSWMGNNSVGYYAQFNSASQTLNAIIGTASGQVPISDPESLTQFNGHWNWLAMTWNASTSTWSQYVNGRLAAQNTSIALHGTPPTTALAVGYFNQSTGQLQPYTGDIAHVAVIPSTLTLADIQAIHSASGVGVPQIGNISHAAQTGAIPTTYTLGVAHSGLSGSGTIATPNLYGCIVTTTTFPPAPGRYGGSPPSYRPALGRIRFSDLNGDNHGTFVEDSPQIILAPDQTNQFIRYSFVAGVVATIQPITIP